MIDADRKFKALETGHVEIGLSKFALTIGQSRFQSDESRDHLDVRLSDQATVEELGEAAGAAEGRSHTVISKMLQLILVLLQYLAIEHLLAEHPNSSSGRGMRYMAWVVVLARASSLVIVEFLPVVRRH